MSTRHIICQTVAILTATLCASAQNILKTIPASGSGRDLISREVISASVYPKKVKPDFPVMEHDMEVVKEDDGSLWVKDKTGWKSLIATPESRDIVLGEAVSRHEFNTEGGIFWSPNRTRVAFYRNDMGAVASFPIFDVSKGKSSDIKYPMTGQPSERLSLGIFDIARETTVWVDVRDFSEERYLTNIAWSPDDRYIFIQVLSRDQHEMHLNQFRADNGEYVRTILTESHDAWVEPYEPIHFLKGSYHFIYSTDNRNGYKNLYVCDTLGNYRRLTMVDADVNYVANNGRSVFYTSAELSPIENHLYRMDIKDAPKISGVRRDGDAVRLTPERGWHEITMDPECTRFHDRWSSFERTGGCVIRDIWGKTVEKLCEGGNPLEGVSTPEVRLGTVKSADGLYDNYFRLFLPTGFDPSKKYPTIVYVYGGPHSQMVKDSWLGGVRMWEVMLAQKGFIVYVQDGRGTLNRGTAYEKAINRRCGVAEMEDQMKGVEMLRSLPYVDPERIGVSGWSYGGFMTISLMENYPEVFKTGACGGPVIDWKWYEVMYGERYMDTPQTNPEGYAATSTLGKVNALKGHHLLVMQGLLDDTVLKENSLSFIQKCIEEGVQVDFFPYPLSEHNVKGLWRAHMYEKLTDWFLTYL